MPILTSIRQSPTYLVCSIVSIFQATPVSSRIRDGPLRNKLITGTSANPSEEDTVASSSRTILQRWKQRAKDLAQIRERMKRDDADLRTYPELEWDAGVRRSSALHPQETRFIQTRRRFISSEGTDALHRFLRLPAEEKVHPDDVPLIALGGSGGGYRATFGFAGFLSAAKQQGLWDCITWTAGVSGSCWTLAAYHTIAYQDISRLIRHYVVTAHPMSIHALDTVARSSKGVYFLIGPLLRKVQDGLVGLGIMDLYATLTTSYQSLSRESQARLSRASFQLSKVWQRAKIDQGLQPMPIFTAVRVAPKDSPGVKPHTDSSMSKCQPPNRALTQHQSQARSNIFNHSQGKKGTTTTGDGRTDLLAHPVPKGFFQWFEISPLEVGSADVQAYIPTWAWGRPFVSGRSLKRQPEHSLSLLLGQCTSAPAGPLTGYVSALLASLPKGTVMSRLLMLLNDFIRMKRWERRWGNPIRAGDEYNPFYGLNATPAAKDEHSRIMGIGVDILHLLRLETVIARQVSRGARKGTGNFSPRLYAADLFARRILCRVELEEWTCMLQAASEDKLLNHLAIRWCAKEAAYKALYPFLIVSWKDLCISKPPSSHGKKPHIALSEEWLSKHQDESIPILHLSVSHDGEYVVTNVLAERSSSSAPLHASSALDSLTPTAAWERSGRIRLMDSGMSNNLPNHILARPERSADVIISFDASSDVQTGSALKRIYNFASDCQLDLTVRPQTSRYAQVIDADSGVTLVYCPLLPSKVLDPATAEFCNSYNLVWTPKQVEMVVQTAEENLQNATETIREVVRDKYESKKRERLETKRNVS